MNKKQYVEYMLPVIESILLAQGFIFKKSKDAFEKKTLNGWSKVNFYFHQFGFDNKINIDLVLRINAVQDIFVKYHDINPGNHKDTDSIGFVLTDLLKHDHNGFAFKTVGELDTILNEKFIPFLQHEVPVLCKKYNDMEGIFSYYYTPVKKIAILWSASMMGT
ncbi:hypothetical protein [Ferruginibacter sp. SUN106]|uniref:hypothetical protein n=1 Tax=Ferruginibacter sp. SUN106 TaxID=2978348 RepID=UPI003D35F680